jgi:hypothetical protein
MALSYSFPTQPIGVSGPLSDAQLRATPVSVSGTVTAGQINSSTSSITSVAASVTSVQLLASTPTRKSFSVYNEATSICYLKFGTTASVTSYTVQIAAGGFYESNDIIYTGEVDAIFLGAVGSVRITELT